LRFTETDIKGCYVIEPEPISDERGWFMRTFCEEEFSVIGKNIHFVQLNHSFNHKKGTVRGLHFQNAPFIDEKLIRCISGALLDVIVDLRKDSPTFLKHIKIEVSAANRSMVFLPKGLAHGFQTLEDNTELIYHHTAFYSKEADSGIRYNDPMVNVDFPLPISIISEKDKNYTLLNKNFSGLII